MVPDSKPILLRTEYDMVRLSPAETLVAFIRQGHTANGIGSQELATVQGEPLSIL